MPNRRLIINADDLGYSRAINRGILVAYQSGVVTETSLMATGPAFEEGVELAKANPSLAIGVHIDLTKFSPVSTAAEISSLLAGDGAFKRGWAMFRGILLGSTKAAHIRTEVFAQVRKARETGIAISHLNTHQHVQGFKPVFDAMLAAAKEFNIPALRVSRETATGGMTIKEAVKRRILGWGARRQRRLIRDAGKSTTDFFWGLDKRIETEPLEHFAQILKSLPEGTHELMCHPGQADEASQGVDSYRERRIRELKVLTSNELRSMIKDCGIELISYRDLAQKQFAG